MKTLCGHVILAALAAVLLSAAAGAAVVIKTDGTRLEGKVTERGDTVTVRVKFSRVRVPRSEVRVILRTSVSTVDRFKAYLKPRDLLILASRAGLRLTLERSEDMVGGLKAAPDAIRAVEALLERLRLTPRHTAEAVRKNVAQFEKDFGVKCLESRHYFVLTDLGPVQARKIAAHMDGIFREYQTRLVFDEKITDRFVVKVYGSQAEYAARGGPPGSSAYFSSAGRELVGYRQRQEDMLFRSLYHEGMHQFLHFYVPNPPTWFDEGLAKYFENAKPTRGVRRKGVPSYKVGGKDFQQTWRVQQAAVRGGMVPLERLIGMTREEFYGANRSLNYGQAWALTHFMIEGRNPLLRKLWKDYFFALRDGATQEEANKKTFGRLKEDVLERLFKRYVKGL